MSTSTRFPPVTLKDDPAFLGYVVGRYIDDDGQDTDDYCVSVSKPGKTKLRGDVRLPAARIERLGHVAG